MSKYSESVERADREIQFEVEKLRYAQRHLRDRSVLLALADLRHVAESLADAEIYAVRGARAIGVSWGDIGKALGTTRQAAQQRFGDFL